MCAKGWKKLTKAVTEGGKHDIRFDKTEATWDLLLLKPLNGEGCI